MPRTQVSHDPHHVSSAIVSQATRYDLKCICYRSVGILSGALDSLCLVFQPSCHLHLCGTAARQKERVHDNVPGYAECILKVALHFVQHILGRTAQNNCACLWILALHQEGEVLVAYLLHSEEAAPGSHRSLCQLLCAVDNVGAADFGNPRVVSFSQASDDRDVCLQQEVLCQVRDTLLSDHKVWLDSYHVIAKLLHLLFFLLEELLPVLLLGNLYVGLTFALLVFKWAI
mmetsp:Transcript_17332/g.40396  ORF Transcript_17332/g.40396 Transcript_17332/m.40396 type:complete len:230 (-) Transcript_17332:818-1507(-)